MASHAPSSAERLAATSATGRHRNGVPASKPYTWQGNLGDAETQAKLAELRARLDQKWEQDQRHPDAVRDLGDADMPFSAPREWHQEDAPTSALATSAAARDAALMPPKMVVLRAVPDPGTGGEVFEQPQPRALPAPEPTAEPEPKVPPEWCKACGYKTARCCCTGGPRDLDAPPPAPAPVSRCRKCGYLKTRCACGGAR